MSEKFQIITAIISVVTPIISIIISIFVSTKKTNSKIIDTQDKIRDTQDKIRDTQDKIRDTQDKIDATHSTCNKLLEIIESTAGIKSNVRGSLTDQHDALKTLIEKENHATYTEVHAMNVRSSEEKIIREEREKHLTPEMTEIKNVIDAVKNQNTLLNDMKVDLDNCRRELVQQKEKNTRLEEEIKRLKNAFDNDDFPDFTQVQGKGRR